MSSLNNIDAAELAARLQNHQPLHLLDVRGEMEYHTYNIGGVNVPLPMLQAEMPDWDKDDEIVVICKAGLRSATAQSILRQNGYTHVRNLTGGLLALQKLK